MTTDDFKSFFLSFFKDVDTSVIDWDAWLYTPGQPLVPNQFDDSLAVEYTNLAQRWIETGGEGASASDIEGWNTKSISKPFNLTPLLIVLVGFLGLLAASKEKVFTTEQLDKLGSIYNVRNSLHHS